MADPSHFLKESLRLALAIAAHSTHNPKQWQQPNFTSPKNVVNNHTYILKK
jgi:hypothetical protein